MNGQLKLRFEWPGLTIGDLVKVVNGCGTLVEDSGLYWFLPLDGEGGEIEIVVRHSPRPLCAGSAALHVRNLQDLGHLSSLPIGGGIQRLLQAVDAVEVLTQIDTRLERLRDRLAKQEKVYIFAAHRNAAKCVRYCRELGHEVAAFIDNDKLKQGGEYLGREVLPLDAVPHDAVIINASGRYCAEINAQLRQANYPWAIDLMELLFLHNLPFQAECGFRSYVSDTVGSRLVILTLYLMLADDSSRAVLDGLVLFRLTLDSAIASKIASPYSQEFFAEDVLHFGSGEVFVDGGAFDGDSYRRFARLAPDFSKAYLFEPDAEICRRAEQEVAGDQRVAICNYGLWSTTGDLRFSGTGGMDGAICDDGEIRIPVVAIDDFVRDKVTHIKLDVEGAEEAALLGGRQRIGESRPKMAVALYHRADDLWKLPALIEALGGSYQYSIRHYSHTVDDSIVYALPID
ncbi:MAG TPA: FkbM family methyltransferase [Accumulibacter sp.]|nr:FkbM family methyltransferase [Accumulibacter sp.]